MMHKTFCILTDYYNYTHAFSGSMNQSPSHSHPLGGMKYSCFSFSLPVTSENLWRPTSPVVPQFPNTWAWFSYCDANRTTRFVLLNADFTAGLWRTFNHFGNIEKIFFFFIVRDDIPAQRTRWRFPQRRSWTSSRVQTDPATCWL